MRSNLPRPARLRATLLALAPLPILLAAPLGAQQEAGDRAWEEHRWEDARVAYRRVLEQDPDAVRANLRLGVMLSWRGRYGRALDHIARARAGDPGDPDIRVVQARVLAWSGRLDHAAASYDSVLAEHPGHLEATIGRGYVDLWRGRLREADRAAAAAWSRDSSSAEVRDFRRAVFLVTRPGIDLSANWANDSDGNTTWWQTIRTGGLLGASLRGFASAGLLEASDDFRAATRASAEAGVAFSRGPLELGAALGARRLSPDSAPARTAATARAQVGVRHGGLRAGVGASRYPWDEIASLIERDLDVEALDGAVEARFARGWSAGTAGEVAWLSDGNRRLSAQATVTHALTSRLTLGAFGRIFGYDRPAQGYFTPDRLTIAEAQGAYTRPLGAWSGRVSGGLGIQRVNRAASIQSQWHVELQATRRWGAANQLDAFVGFTNSAVSSTTGAFRSRRAGLSVRLGL